MPEVTPICQFGTKAISFSLKGIDEKTYNLEEIKGKNGTLVIFICNHCPYVKGVIDRLVKDIIDLQKKLEEYEKIEKRINELPFEINLLKEEEDKLIEKELLDQAEQKSHKRFTLLDELKSLRQLKDSFNDSLDLFGNCTFIIN